MTISIRDLVAIRNRNQPHSGNNLDPVQYDYLFWTEMEKVAKRERGKSLDALKSVSKNPDKPGVIVRGALYQTELKQSEPFRTFDKEVFIDLLLEKFPELNRPVLREIATAAVVDGTRRKTYTVSAIGESDD